MKHPVEDLQLGQRQGVGIEVEGFGLHLYFPQLHSFSGRWHCDQVEKHAILHLQTLKKGAE
jgi:hypothetical protein